jgi:hypothetical protein
LKRRLREMKAALRNTSDRFLGAVFLDADGVVCSSLFLSGIIYVSMMQ